MCSRDEYCNFEDPRCTKDNKFSLLLSPYLNSNNAVTHNTDTEKMSLRSCLKNRVKSNGNRNPMLLAMPKKVSFSNVHPSQSQKQRRVPPNIFAEETCVPEEHAQGDFSEEKYNNSARCVEFVNRRYYNQNVKTGRMGESVNVMAPPPPNPPNIPRDDDDDIEVGYRGIARQKICSSPYGKCGEEAAASPFCPPVIEASVDFSHLKNDTIANPFAIPSSAMRLRGDYANNQTTFLNAASGNVKLCKNVHVVRGNKACHHRKGGNPTARDAPSFYPSTPHPIKSELFHGNCNPTFPSYPSTPQTMRATGTLRCDSITDENTGSEAARAGSNKSFPLASMAHVQEYRDDSQQFSHQQHQPFVQYAPAALCNHVMHPISTTPVSAPSYPATPHSNGSNALDDQQQQSWSPWNRSPGHAPGHWTMGDPVDENTHTENTSLVIPPPRAPADLEGKRLFLRRAHVPPPLSIPTYAAHEDEFNDEEEDIPPAPLLHADAYVSREMISARANSTHTPVCKESLSSWDGCGSYVESCNAHPCACIQRVSRENTDLRKNISLSDMCGAYSLEPKSCDVTPYSPVADEKRPGRTSPPPAPTWAYPDTDNKVSDVPPAPTWSADDSVLDGMSSSGGVPMSSPKSSGIPSPWSPNAEAATFHPAFATFKMPPPSSPQAAHAPFPREENYVLRGDVWDASKSLFARYPGDNSTLMSLSSTTSGASPCGGDSSVGNTFNGSLLWSPLEEEEKRTASTDTSTDLQYLENVCMELCENLAFETANAALASDEEADDDAASDGFGSSGSHTSNPQWKDVKMELHIKGPLGADVATLGNVVLFKDFFEYGQLWDLHQKGLISIDDRLVEVEDLTDPKEMLVMCKSFDPNVEKKVVIEHRVQLDRL